MILFRDVTKKFGSGEPVLDNINFEIEKGSFVYLVGPTGAGKTSIFRLIIRDLLPTSGEISIGEWNLVTLPKSKLPDLRRKVGVVFQDLKLLVDRTVIENVMLPLELSGVSERDARRAAEEILISVGLAGKFDKFPLQLSGGERQRVAIARALVFDPDIILADEPTGNLDSKTSFQILDLLKSINARGTTVFMATHNDKIIEKSHNRILIIESGKLVDDKDKSKNADEKKSAKDKEEKRKEEHEGKTEKEAKEGSHSSGEKVKLASLASEETS
jgi:cell division transport system ATP-binding protein